MPEINYENVSTFVPSGGVLLQVSKDAADAITSANAEISDIVRYFGLFESDDAFETGDDVTSEPIRALGGRTVREVVSEANVTFTAALLEDTKAVRELRYGSVEDSNGKIVWNPRKRIRGSFVFYTFDEGEGVGEIVHKLYVYKDAQVSEAESTSFSTGSATVTNVTLTAYEDPEIWTTVETEDVETGTED